jgi:hypothetical protein
MVGLLGYGYGSGDGKVSALRDMFNGGGRGTAGDTFEGGGGYSGILNMLGIKPKDYADRHAMMAQPQPQAQQQAAPMPAPPVASQAAPQDFYRQTGNPAMAQTPWNATQAGPQDFYNMPQNNPAMAQGMGAGAISAAPVQAPSYASFLSGLPAGTLQNSPEFLRKLYEMGQNHTPTFMPPPSGVMR